MNVDIRHLRAFLTVAAEQNFTRAAERLHMTQPTLSVIIRDLETALNVKLFDRTTRSVNLTVAGRYLLPDARRMVRDMERTLADIRSITDLEQGSVKLAVLPSIATSLVPAALASFCRQYPAIDIQIIDCPADGIIAAVEASDADLGITVLTPELAAGYSTTLLAQDALVAVLPAAHPLAQNSAITWRALGTESLIAMRTGTSVRHLMDKNAILATWNLQVAFEVSYMSSAIALTQAGLGIAVLPSLGVGSLDETELSVRPLLEPRITRQIALIQRKDRWIPPAAEAFKATLQALSLDADEPGER